jgi:hypothetical protein
MAISVHVCRHWSFIIILSNHWNSTIAPFKAYSFITSLQYRYVQDERASCWRMAVLVVVLPSHLFHPIIRRTSDDCARRIPPDTTYCSCHSSCETWWWNSLSSSSQPTSQGEITDKCHKNIQFHSGREGLGSAEVSRTGFRRLKWRLRSVYFVCLNKEIRWVIQLSCSAVRGPPLHRYDMFIEPGT